MAANPRKSRPNKIERCKADTKAAQGHERRIRADLCGDKEDGLGVNLDG
jgi:hypothetical protein